MNLAPTSADVASGERVQFSATLTSTSNTAVVWHVSGGTIKGNGLFTAPSVSSVTKLTVTATSVADSSRTATSQVTVSPLANLSMQTNALPAGTAGIPYTANLKVAGGVGPYSWQVSGGALPKGLSLDQSSGTIAGITSLAGNFSFTASVRDANGSKVSGNFTLTFARGLTTPPAGAASLVPQDENAYCSKGDIWTGPATDGHAILPRNCVYTSLDGSPSRGKVTLLASGGDVVKTVTAASCGDTILLQAGGTYTFTGSPALPTKNCDAQHWITIRTDAADASLPAEHVRINPSYAGVASLPGRPAYHGPNQNVMAKLVIGLSPISIGDHYRLIGLEVTRPADGKWYNALLTPAGSHIIIDRSWIHGDPVAETTHLIQMHDGADHVAVINSYITDAHCTAVTGACIDAQAIADGGHATTVKVYNSFLEGSAETFEFGGSTATLITSDIEIRLNHMFKPMIWNPSDPSYFGHKFITKNLFEMKQGTRALIEGNILENTWGGFSQTGAAILLTPKNQAGADGTNLCPKCYVSDVTMRYNYVLHAATGMVLGFGPSDNGGWPAGSYRYSIHNILYDGMQYPTCYGCGFILSQIGSSYDGVHTATDVMHDVKFDHLTYITNGFHPGGGTAFLNLGGPPANNALGNPQEYNMNFTNSIADLGQQGIVSPGGGADNCLYGKNSLAAAIAACWVGASSFTSNAWVEDASTRNFLFPAGNTVVKSWSEIGFVNFRNGDGGDYHLTSSSPFYKAGSDGKDLGADIDAINAAVSFAR